MILHWNLIAASYTPLSLHARQFGRGRQWTMKLLPIKLHKLNVSIDAVVIMGWLAGIISYEFWHRLHADDDSSAFARTYVRMYV